MARFPVAGGGVSASSKPSGSRVPSVNPTTGAVRVNGEPAPEFWGPHPLYDAAADTANLTALINAVNAAGGGAVRLPPGQYKVNALLPEITTPIHLSGATGGVNQVTTEIEFAAGLIGLRIGTSGNPNPSTVERLSLYGPATGNGTVDSNHGIVLANGGLAHRTTIRDVEIQGFSGDGVNAVAGVGNTIMSRYEGVRVKNCNGNGMFISTQNSSVSTLIGCEMSACGLFGYRLEAPGCLLLNCLSEICDHNPGRTVTDVQLTAGSNIITSATANFTDADVGMLVEDLMSTVTPPFWASGTTYAQNAVVKEVIGGGTVYFASVQSGNLNHDPQADATGTWWVASRLPPPNIPLNAIGPAIDQVISPTQAAVRYITSPLTGSGVPVKIHAGGALYDNSMGNGYLNFYAEAGSGGNCIMGPNNTQTWWMGGGWTGAYFANGLPEFIYFSPGVGKAGTAAAMQIPTVLSPLFVNSQDGTISVELAAGNGGNPQVVFNNATGVINGAAGGTQFAGPFWPPSLGGYGFAQGDVALWAAVGAPDNAKGSNGDIYFRHDGGAGTTIYQKRTGTWTGIV